MMATSTLRWGRQTHRTCLSLLINYYYYHMRNAFFFVGCLFFRGLFFPCETVRYSKCKLRKKPIKQALVRLNFVDKNVIPYLTGGKEKKRTFLAPRSFGTWRVENIYIYIYIFFFFFLTCC